MILLNLSFEKIIEAPTIWILFLLLTTVFEKIISFITKQHLICRKSTYIIKRKNDGKYHIIIIIILSDDIVLILY